MSADPKLFPYPSKFDPSRFENSEGNDSQWGSSVIPYPLFVFWEPLRLTHIKYSFLPFGMGSRQCLGRQFAVIVMISLVSSVLKNLDVERTSNTIQGITLTCSVMEHFIWIAKDIPASYGITMAPSKEIYLKFTKRIWRKIANEIENFEKLGF